MADEQTPEKIQGLLNLCPGIHSAEVRYFGVEIATEFRCNSFHDLRCVDLCASFANTGIMVAAFHDHMSNIDNDLKFTMELAHGIHDTSTTQAELFGIHLTRDLRSRNLITQSHCDDLLLGWNAADFRR